MPLSRLCRFSLPISCELAAVLPKSRRTPLHHLPRLSLNSTRNGRRSGLSSPPQDLAAAAASAPLGTAADAREDAPAPPPSPTPSPRPRTAPPFARLLFFSSTWGSWWSGALNGTCAVDDFCPDLCSGSTKPVPWLASSHHEPKVRPTNLVFLRLTTNLQ
jgi:hypothetical protein